MATAGIAARTAALRLLGEVLDRGRTLDQALGREQGPGGRLHDLEARDRAFARLLVATVLRRLGQIDDAVARCLDRPLNRSARPARNVLRLAAAQAMFLETPAHAVGDSSVRLLHRQRHLSGLVNAVARRLGREGPTIARDQDAARLNCPDWLWRSWTDCHGEATTQSMVAEMLREPALDLSLKDGPEDWAERLAADILPTGGLRRPAGGAVEELEGYAEGAWWVQDAAASIPARLFGEVAGRRVLDLCAAPGGKTAQLAAAGAQVTAVDNAPKRLEMLRRNLQRLSLEVEVVEADALQWRPGAPFELILLDAPCTATGTIRRHPDIWRLRTPEDVGRLAALQDRLLDAAVDMLAPGGTLIYATCSLQPEEGPERIAALLSERPDLHRRPLMPEEVFDQAELIDQAGDLRTLPHQLGGIDGFYACRLGRSTP
ncbi:MAG: transcription antitermination factor NusB [Alphaproteobacteria bacterium]|jgi:16S rRNA (cytosine967-C5)-methyltransferase|nr:transcription antitermination factor NusB [Alphaproteobacteria bacterium]